jgi:putative restriction endonuclease
LGWHAGYDVFVGFDIAKHEGQASQSPSIQIKERTLQNAHVHAFAVYPRQTGEIAVAFRPEFLIEYARSLVSLHQTGRAIPDMALLNNLDALERDRLRCAHLSAPKT